MSDRRQAISSWFKMYARKIAVALIAISLAMGAWVNLLLHINTSLNTENKRNLPSILAIKIDNYPIKQQVKKDFYEVIKSNYIQTFFL